MSRQQQALDDLGRVVRGQMSTCCGIFEIPGAAVQDETVQRADRDVHDRSGRPRLPTPADPERARAWNAVAVEQRLEGGNAGGAVLVEGTVRRATGPWTPAVHALLRHLQKHDFVGVPRVLGVDERGREILTFVPGLTIGTAKPWPAWVHSDDALRDVGGWLRRYHDCVRGFVPPIDAQWRIGSHRWQPGDVVGHNDAAPYNAVWREEAVARGRLVGFVDWDFASPCPPVGDLAFAAFSWVPLHAREVVRAEGFGDFAARPRRLRLFLDAYGWTGTVAEVLDAVQARLAAHVGDVRALAEAGDPLFAGLVDAGGLLSLEQAMRELDRDRPELEATPPA